MISHTNLPSAKQERLDQSSTLTPPDCLSTAHVCNTARNTLHSKRMHEHRSMILAMADGRRAGGVSSNKRHPHTRAMVMRETCDLFKATYVYIYTYIYTCTCTCTFHYSGRMISVGPNSKRRPKQQVLIVDSISIPINEIRP